MEYFNFKVLFLVAFVPIIIRVFWYSPKIFGERLSQTINPSPIDEKRTYGSYIMMYLFGLFAAYMLCMIVIHQFGFFLLHFNELVIDNVPSESIQGLADFVRNYGERHRSLGHGVIHGIEAGVMLGLFFIGTISIIEKRPLKNIFIHLGYFVLTFGIMGALLSAYL